MNKRRLEKERWQMEQLKRAQDQLSQEYRQKLLSEQIIKEAKLIARLKITQQRQRQAYEKLELVL